MIIFEFDCTKETVDLLRELVKDPGEKNGCFDGFEVEVDVRIRSLEVTRRLLAPRIQ